MQHVFAAMKAVIVHDGNFLVLKQENNGKTFWDLPGGKIEHDETPFETLKREVKEETGLAIEIGKPLGVWWFFRKHDNAQVICTTFECTPNNTDVDIHLNPSTEKIMEFQWVSKEAFLQKEYSVGNESLKKLIREWAPTKL